MHANLHDWLSCDPYEETLRDLAPVAPTWMPRMAQNRLSGQSSQSSRDFEPSCENPLEKSPESYFTDVSESDGSLSDKKTRSQYNKIALELERDRGTSQPDQVMATKVQYQQEVAEFAQQPEHVDAPHKPTGYENANIPSHPAEHMYMLHPECRAADFQTDFDGRQDSLGSQSHPFDCGPLERDTEVVQLDDVMAGGVKYRQNFPRFWKSRDHPHAAREFNRLHRPVKQVVIHPDCRAATFEAYSAEGREPSLGSQGHPFDCGFPCKYEGRLGNCRNGAACLSCHFCPWTRRTARLPALERLALSGVRADAMVLSPGPWTICGNSVRLRL